VRIHATGYMHVKHPLLLSPSSANVTLAVAIAPHSMTALHVFIAVSGLELLTFG
jgi:hypothetical protein